MDRNEKRKEKACQTSINTHPASAPEGRPRTGSRSSRTRQVDMNRHKTSQSLTCTSLYTARLRRIKPPSLRTVREDQRTIIHSRVSRICSHQPGWILWLFWGTKRWVDYYRNDSPEGEVSKESSGDGNPVKQARRRLFKVGVCILKYCRREEEKKKRPKRRRKSATLY